jgi:hypothetical protein
VVEINPEETPLTRYVHESIRAASGEVMPGIVERLREVKGGLCRDKKLQCEARYVAYISTEIV